MRTSNDFKVGFVVGLIACPTIGCFFQAFVLFIVSVIGTIVEAFN
jgi:hypothetical protein